MYLPTQAMWFPDALKLRWMMRTPDVLLVEDNEAERAVLTEFLQEAGYTVWSAPPGQSALERLRTHPASLVVMLELLAPGRDDLAFLQAIVADPV